MCLFSYDGFSRVKSGCRVCPRGCKVRRTFVISAIWGRGGGGRGGFWCALVRLRTLSGQVFCAGCAFYRACTRLLSVGLLVGRGRLGC